LRKSTALADSLIVFTDRRELKENVSDRHGDYYSQFGDPESAIEETLNQKIPGLRTTFLFLYLLTNFGIISGCGVPNPGTFIRIILYAGQELRLQWLLLLVVSNAFVDQAAAPNPPIVGGIVPVGYLDRAMKRQKVINEDPVATVAERENASLYVASLAAPNPGSGFLTDHQTVFQIVEKNNLLCYQQRWFLSGRFR
jgi:hypothetical protein